MKEDAPAGADGGDSPGVHFGTQPRGGNAEANGDVLQRGKRFGMKCCGVHAAT